MVGMAIESAVAVIAVVGATAVAVNEPRVPLPSQAATLLILQGYH